MRSRVACGMPRDAGAPLMTTETVVVDNPRWRPSACRVVRFAGALVGLEITPDFVPPEVLSRLSVSSANQAFAAAGGVAFGPRPGPKLSESESGPVSKVSRTVSLCLTMLAPQGSLTHGYRKVSVKYSVKAFFGRLPERIRRAQMQA